MDTPLYLTSTEFTLAGIKTAAQIWAMLVGDIEAGVLWLADLASTEDSDLEYKAESLLELMVRFDAAEVVTQLSKLVLKLKIEGTLEDDEDLIYLSELLQAMAEDLELKLRLPTRVVIPVIYEWPEPNAEVGEEWERYQTETLVVAFDS